MGVQKIVGTCSVDGCGNDLKVRGLCPMHYHKWQRYGDPTVVKRPMVKGLSLEDRFWSKVRTGEPDECWEWQGYCHPKTGYGTITVDKSLRLAHRLAWELTNGRPPALDILHSCDNRKCCNPNHLREGTAADNFQDMVDRGRRVVTKGEEHFNAILTEDQVRAIRLDTRKYALIENEYGLSSGHVSRIKHYKLWAHVQ